MDAIPLFFLLGFAARLARSDLKLPGQLYEALSIYLLLATLAASASYIAVPAAMRIAVPEANPGLSITAALVITFPFNILIGIPLYDRIVGLFFGS